MIGKHGEQIFFIALIWVIRTLPVLHVDAKTSFCPLQGSHANANANANDGFWFGFRKNSKKVSHWLRPPRPAATSCHLPASSSLSTGGSPRVDPPADYIPSSSSMSSASMSSGHPPPPRLPQIFTSQTTVALSSGQDAGTQWQWAVREANVQYSGRWGWEVSLPPGVCM